MDEWSRLTLPWRKGACPVPAMSATFLWSERRQEARGEEVRIFEGSGRFVLGEVQATTLVSPHVLS
jgi:hypothetical protein